MNSIKVKAYSCGSCHHLYKFDERGKQLSEGCCRCRTKNCTGFIEYTAISGALCKKCRLEESIPEQEKWIEKSVQELRHAKEELKRLNKNKISIK